MKKESAGRGVFWEEGTQQGGTCNVLLICCSWDQAMPTRVPSMLPCSHLSFFESDQGIAAGTGPSKAVGATNPGTQPEEGQGGPGGDPEAEGHSRRSP